MDVGTVPGVPVIYESIRHYRQEKKSRNYHSKAERRRKTSVSRRVQASRDSTHHSRFVRKHHVDIDARSLIGHTISGLKFQTECYGNL